MTIVIYNQLIQESFSIKVLLFKIFNLLINNKKNQSHKKNKHIKRKHYLIWDITQRWLCESFENGVKK